MRITNVARMATWAFTILAVCAGFAIADGKKDAKEKSPLSGTWTKKEGQLKIEFIDKDTMKLYPHGDKAEIAIVCKYSINKEGLLKAKVAEHEGSAELREKVKNVVPVGLKFEFQWKIKGGTAQLDNVEGKDTEGMKAHLEGEYASKS